MEGPGVGKKKIPAVEAAAEEYVRVRDRRMDLTDKEVEAKQKLIDLLHKHSKTIGVDGEGVLRYRYDDMVIELSPGKENLKVRTAGEPGEE